MPRLQDIAVRTQTTECVSRDHLNTTPILHEILHALRRLVARGEPTTIDLRAIPFGPGDEERLLETLGKGEVSVELDTLGSSRIRESAYSGVWIVDHRNAEDQRIALQIEIARVPVILSAQAEDMADSLERLEHLLNPNRSDSAGPGPEQGRSSDG